MKLSWKMLSHTIETKVVFAGYSVAFCITILAIGNTRVYSIGKTSYSNYLFLALNVNNP